MSSEEYIKWGDVKVDLGDHQIPEVIVGLLKEIVTDVLIGCQFVYIPAFNRIVESPQERTELKARAFCTPSNADVEITINWDWYAEFGNISETQGISFSIEDKRRSTYENSKPAFSGTRAIELNTKYKE